MPHMDGEETVRKGWASVTDPFWWDSHGKHGINLPFTYCTFFPIDFFAIHVGQIYHFSMDSMDYLATMFAVSPDAPPWDWNIY